MKTRNPSLFFLPLGIFLLLCPAKSQGQSALTENQKELQVLNRLTFGPRPADLKRIHRMGIQPFIEEQLYPEKITDSACEKDLRGYPTLWKSTEVLLEEFPDPANPIRRPDLKKRKVVKRSADEAYRKTQTMIEELATAKLTRAVESERQLNEIMVDFWFNHFNVFSEKNEVRWLLTSYERDVLRPHALGKFHDLLLAVAQSPAMLVYLDNASNRANPDPNRPGNPQMKLNENYGRELLELHTVGVDGGYSQKDVTEAARVLTGWGIQGTAPRSAPVSVRFKFKPYQHDPGVKTVMGQTYGPDGGVEEGLKLIDFLSRHPSTARFISKKLCRRFLCDDPPEGLVKRVAGRFSDSGGDIRETLRTLFNSPEFLDARYYKSKVKTPFEFVASGLRSAGTTVLGWEEVLWTLRGMGEPLYLCEPPTGYPDVAKAWLGSGSLLSRVNFAERLFSRPYGGYLRTDMDRLASGAPFNDPQKTLDGVIHSLLADQVEESTRAALGKQMENPEISDVPLAGRRRGVDIKKVAMLVLSTPDFQKR